jgi:hypothetical protein
MTRMKPSISALVSALDACGSKKKAAQYFDVSYTTVKKWYSEIDASKERDILSIDTSAENATDLKKGKFKEHGLVLNNLNRFCLKEMYEQAGLGPDEVYKIIVLPDTHYPDHDEPSIHALMQFLRDYQPHGLGSIGDFIENGQVSHWNKNNSLSEAIKEMKGSRALMKEILKAAGDPKLKFITLGNHEAWLDQYLEDNQEFRDLLKEIGITPTALHLCGLKELGFKSFPYNEVLSIGHANFTHGFYTSDANAKAHLAVVGDNIFYGHCESVQSYSGVSLRGKHVSQCIGTLRKLKGASFLRNRPTNWVNGFLIIEFQYNGLFTHSVPLIINGTFCYNGKVYGK